MLPVQRITVWYDDTSEDKSWIVSLDTDHTTDTLHVTETEGAALILGRQEAKKRGLNLYDAKGKELALE